MNGNGPLDFEATINNAQFNGVLDEMTRRIRGTSDSVVKEGIRMDEAFRKAAISIGAYFSFQQAKQFAVEIANVRGEFQQLGIAFEVMLGSKEKADKLMQEQIAFSQKTPFTLIDVATNTKQLMAMGVAYEDVMGTMKALGDVAAGVSVPITRIAINYGQVMNLGKLQEREVRDFAMAGIPLIEELSKNLGKSKQEITEMISESQIAATDVTKAFQTMSGEGGRFFNLMEKQNASVTGQISNLQDKIQVMLNEIGKSNEGMIYGSIEGATVLVKNYEEVGKILLSIAGIVGVNKAAVIAYSSISTVAASKDILMNELSFAGKVKNLTVMNAMIIKQRLLNVTMLANPYVLAATALASLAAAMWLMHDNTTAAQKAIERFNDYKEKSIDLEKQHKSEIDGLISSIQDQAIADIERTRALETLKREYPSIFSQYDIEKLKLADILIIKKEIANIDSVRKADELKSAYEKQLAIVKSLESQLKEASSTPNISSIAISALERELEIEKVMLQKFNEEVQQDRITAFVSGLEKMNAIELQNELALRKKAIERASNIPFPTNQFVEGSIAGMFSIDQIKEQTNALEIELAKRNEATFTFTELQKKYTDELKAAEKELADLKAKNLPVGQWNEELAKVDAKIKAAKSNLEALTGKQKTEKKETKTPEEIAADQLRQQVELVGNLIDEAKKKYTDLGEYITFLRSEIRKTLEAPESGFNNVKIAELYTELVDSEKEYIRTSEDTYKALIGQSKNFTQQRINAEQEYLDTINKLDKTTLGEDRYNAAIQAAKDALKTKLNLINEEEIKSSDAYKSIVNNLDQLSRGSAKRYLQLLKDQLETLKDQPELYAELKRLIEETEKSLKGKTVAGINEIADGFNQASQLVRQFDEDLANVVDTIGQVVSGIGQIASGNYIGGVLQIGTALMSSIMNAAENRAKKAEEREREYLDSLKEKLSNINTLLERQIDLINQLSGTEKLKGYSDAFNEIGNEISNTLSKLNGLDLIIKHDRGLTNVDLDPLINTYGEVFGNDRTNPNKKFDIGIINRLIQENRTATDKLYEELLNGNLSGDQAEEVKLLIENLEANTAKFEDLKAQYNEYITGTNVSSIVDTIASGFEEGKRSAEDFADTFEDLMRKAIIQGIKMKLLEEPLKKWYDEFAIANEDGLTAAESEYFEKWYNSIATGAAKAYDDASAFLGDAANIQSDTTLSGAIKGVTQETASIIAGQMNAIRMNQAQSLGLMNEQLLQLYEIAANTRYNRKLDLLVDIKNILQGNSGNQANYTRSQGGT